MYINNKELLVLKSIINKYQVLIDDQTESKNQLFPEGIFYARELANEGEQVIESITNREVKSRAKKIIKNRSKD